MAEDTPTSTAKSVVEPRWLRKPRPDDFARVYPYRAERDGVAGVAVIRCSVNIKGRLEACVTISETPTGYEFGKAALRLAPRFQMQAKTPDGRPVEGGTVTIPLNFYMAL